MAKRKSNCNPNCLNAKGKLKKGCRFAKGKKNCPIPAKSSRARTKKMAAGAARTIPSGFMGAKRRRRKH